MPPKSIPWDPREYSLLAPDLSGPLAWLDREAARSEVDALHHKVGSLLGLGPQGMDLCNDIKDRILQVVRSNGSDGQRQSLLKTWIGEYREALTQHAALRGAVGSGRTTTAVQQIASLYFQFDVKKFTEDFGVVLADEIANGAVAAEITDCRKQTTALLQKLQPISAKRYPKFFTDGIVPPRWRDFSIEAMGEWPFVDMILGQFIRDYRARAPGFLEPVTVAGLAIRCLPTSRRKPWEVLYDRLGFANVRRFPTYEPIILNIPDDAPEAKSLPGKFAG